jgi:hypothetical protein
MGESFFLLYVRTLLNYALSDYAHLAADRPVSPTFLQHREFFPLVSAVVWLLARGSSDFLIKNNLTTHVTPADR